MKKALFLILTLLWANAVASAAFAQDVSSLDAPNAKVAVPGIVTAGQPSLEDFAKLKALGITTVVNARGAEESPLDEAALAAEHGLTYVAIPIDGKEALTRDAALALKAVLDMKTGGVLLHCASGNRAGALMALEAFYSGDKKSAADAIALGKAAGMTSLTPYISEKLEAEAHQ
jgi:uncharacterized protein (TIGR01244 family)